MLSCLITVPVHNSTFPLARHSIALCLFADNARPDPPSLTLQICTSPPLLLALHLLRIFHSSTQLALHTIHQILRINKILSQVPLQHTLLAAQDYAFALACRIMLHEFLEEDLPPSPSALSSTYLPRAASAEKARGHDVS